MATGKTKKLTAKVNENLKTGTHALANLLMDKSTAVENTTFTMAQSTLASSKVVTNQA
jgi:hypothetical protein